MPLIDVYLGLGSNIERETHLCAGLDALHELFGNRTARQCLKASR